jgi:hypothetical protein
MGKSVASIIERRKQQRAREGYAQGLSDDQFSSLKEAEQRAERARTKQSAQELQERVSRTRGTIISVHSRHGHSLPLADLEQRKNAYIARLQWDRENQRYALTSGNRGIVVFVNQNPREGIIVSEEDTHLVNVRVVGSSRTVIKTVMTHIGTP